mmetsp:Transcript_3835/g.7345  ORF Transcript_3835/g.7345 Transcript_3835/m.7345 type:complete len:1001 (-) Transcript_3835:217-3219(-)
MPSSKIRMDDGTEEEVPNLPKLLAALEVGKQVVSALPKNSNRNGQDDESDDDANQEEDDDDDEFDYQMAFSEFKNLCLESRTELATLLSRSLESTACFETVMDNSDFNDPVLWEHAAEACDILSERVDQYIQNVKEGRIGLEGAKVSEAVERFGELARNKVKGGLQQILSGLVEMEKPQVKYNFYGTVQNSRTEPFVPQLHPDKPFSLNSSFILEPIPGHGLETRQFGGSSGDYLQSVPNDIIAPFEHYPHPYREEIERLKYRPWQLTVDVGDNGTHGTSGTLNNPSLSQSNGVWIDTVADLMKLANRIAQGGDNMREIAIDLEAHSFRSFSGFTCLMQVSLRRPTVNGGEMAQPSEKDNKIDTAYDFVIDTLALRHAMNETFAPIMANPDIVKVMHGADSDIGWLQRDFGIYVVNLFDTGRACRLLPHFSQASLAYLLRKYANIEADKKHQLSDWRQRPLPPDMLSYAVSDTKYLLDVYDKIRLELIQHDKERNDISITSVLDASKKVCLIRYDKEPFYPGAYKKLLMSRRGKHAAAMLNDDQDSLLKKLFDWRDNVAREEDESVQYVCGNSGLVRIATMCPQTLHELRSCVNPLPPLIQKYADDISRLVRITIGESQSDMLMDKAVTVDRNVNSMSQQSNMILANEEDETSSIDSNVNYITMNPTNTNFSSTETAAHNLVMKPSISIQGQNKGVDGFGAVKAATSEGEEGSHVKEGTVAKETVNAQKAAERIRTTLVKDNQNLIGLAKSSNLIFEDESTTQLRTAVEHSSESDTDEGESVDIPKSMKEIYKMSNKNRRKAKKIPVHFSDDEDVDDMDISKAEKIISSSGPDGKDYFSYSPSKRQCLKMEDVDENKKNDIAFMMDLGWIKDEKEAVNMLSEQRKTLESAESVNTKEHSPDYDTESNVERKSKSRRGGKPNSKSSNITFDYTKVGAVGVGVSNRMESNPFFEGVAISSSGALDSQGGKARERKKPSNARKTTALKKNVNVSGNKTHVYRK